MSNTTDRPYRIGKKGTFYYHSASQQSFRPVTGYSVTIGEWPDIEFFTHTDKTYWYLVEVITGKNAAHHLTRKDAVEAGVERIKRQTVERLKEIVASAIETGETSPIYRNKERKEVERDEE